jgi:hypothetical protein
MNKILLALTIIGAISLSASIYNLATFRPNLKT